MQSESQAIDGGEVNWMVHRSGCFEETPDLLDTEDGGKAVFVLGANERQGMPVAMEDVLVEESDAAVADTPGSGGEAIDIFAMQEVGLKLLFCYQVWRFTLELREQADLTDIGLLGAFAFATKLESGNHLLTQWGHEISPFLS